MKKPKPIETITYYNYKEVIEYIERKYQIDTKKYRESLRFNQFLNVTNYTKPIEPKELTDKERKNLNNRNQYLKDKIMYRKEEEKMKKEFHDWLREKGVKIIEHSNFHQWLTERYIEHDYLFKLPILELLTNKHTPKWVKEILQLISEEFKTDTIYLKW